MNLEYFNAIKALVLFTTVFAFSVLAHRNIVHRYALLILLCCLTTETIISILLFLDRPTGLVTTICGMFFNGLWLALLAEKSIYKNTIRHLIVAFVLFGMANLLFFEGSRYFNYYTFVAGAFLYLALFIFESFVQLKRENLAFFQSNDYLLLVSPVILLFGLSFMFGFQSRSITSALIINKVKLYDFVICFVNAVFYILLNLYIYREKK